ncbi:MAG: FxsA family protein [Casimicrobiaceae bacterium]
MLREARGWERAVLVIAALLLIKPGYISDAFGLLLLAAVFASQKLSRVK